MARAQRSGLVLLVVTLALLAGCTREATIERKRAETLAQWLAAQSYSSWSTFKHQGQTPRMPASPDGLTLGSPNVFAAVGCDPNDLSAVDVLWGDRRTARPLAGKLTVAVTTGTDENDRVPLSDFESQTLQRVRHTSIAVSRSEGADLSVTCVDFAPMGDEDSFLARWFLIENAGQSARRVGLAFHLAAMGEWEKSGSRVWRRGGRLGVVSDGELTPRDDWLESGLRRLQPGEQRAFSLLVVPARDAKRLAGYSERAEAALARLPELLEETKLEWEEWRGRVPLETGDPRMDDLLDSLLCLLRSHVGAEAIHTGSLRYPHNRAWVRDSYWVQRALLELGLVDEARLNLDFFLRAWRAAGLASHYEIPAGEAAGWGYHRVEVPHYLVLMVRDAERLGDADGLIYWEMVRGALDQAAVPESGLQPMNGDETWLLAAPVRELDALIDNSWLLIASAEYGAELAARAGDLDRAARYQAMGARARLALRRFAPEPGQVAWYATGRGGDGSLDLFLCPAVLARGAILGVLPSTDPRLAAGLVASWERLSFPRGIRAHARSTIIDGGTPGYLLYAAGSCPGCESLTELAQRVQSFCSATGCVWEYHDQLDPAWGGEKRRLWDSAVLLMGLVRALFDVHRDGQRVEFVLRPQAPHPPPATAPEFNAEALLAKAGPALILYRRAREHAARLARELVRHRNALIAVAEYPGAPPATHSAVIVSPDRPPAGWRQTERGYWVRVWNGPPQLWVRSKGDVYRDTDALLVDLLSYLAPRRERPLPYPDANYELVSRLGEEPAGKAAVSLATGARRRTGEIDLTGDDLTLSLGEEAVRVLAVPDGGKRMLTLRVRAEAPRESPITVTITLPGGWWLVYARDMSAKWDRVFDPAQQIRRPDGGVDLVCFIRPGQSPVGLSFDLGRLRVGRAEGG